MIRTTKKEIEQEIRAGRYTEILDYETAKYCVFQCRWIAYSYRVYRCTGLVFVAHNMEMYATTSRNVIGKISSIL